MRILFLTQICPYPPTNGGAIKSYNILKHLGSRHKVDVLTFIRCESEAAALSQLAEHCRRIDFCMMPRSPALNALHAVRSLWRRQPFLIIRDWQPQMHAKVLNYLEPPPDLIYVDHLQMFQYVPRPAPSPVLLDEHNVEWRIIERFAACDESGARRLFASIEWPKLRAFELDACQAADAVLTVTPNDREVLREKGVPGSKMTVLPIGVDTGYFKPLPRDRDSRRVLTFGTMSWPPNIDGVLHFCRHIYPSVKREVPEVELAVVGANPPPQLKRLATQDRSIVVTGYVEDIRKASEGAAAFVVPLRIGSGMRVKILDAMSMGLPVVSTSMGCEGISARPDTEILVTDEPREFARAVVHLLKHPSERARLGAAGRALVEREYSWPAILPRLDELLDRMGSRQK